MSSLLSVLWANVYITNQFLFNWGGGGGRWGHRMWLWAPVLLWTPAFLLFKNITKSIKIMLILTFQASTPTHMYVSQHNTHKLLQCTTGIQATTIYSLLQKSRKATVCHSGRDVVFRDIKTKTVTQMRDVYIRDKIIKDCILLGSPWTVGIYSSRIVSCLHVYF